MPTLHIIGNGFDLAHGLPTSYWDYHQFLKENGEDWFIGMMENYFGNLPALDGYRQQGNILWSDLEKALGEYNVDDIFSYLKDGHTLDIDRVQQSIDEVEAELKYHFVDIKQQFQETFADWCRSIDVTKAKAKIIPHFDPNGLFLTFNYSDTLERVYGIPDKNILHIHGRASNPDSEIIVGHNNPAKLTKAYKEDFYDVPAYMNIIVETINGLHKDQEGIIGRNAKFFNSLNVIDKVVVYGHSMEAVDMPYFEAVQSEVQSNTRWHFSYYNEEEKDVKRDKAHSIGAKLCSNPFFQI